MAKVTADFTNVKESSGFNPKQMPEGDYVATITKADVGKSKADKQQIVLGITLNDMRTVTYPYYCGLDTDQLWKIRNVMIAAGMTVPKKKMTIDTDKLIGKEIGISLEDDEYEGKMKSVIMGVFSADEVDEGLPSDVVDEDEEDEDDDEEEVVAPKAKAKKKKAPEPEPEEDEDDEEDDEEEEEPEPAPKKPSARTLKRRAEKAAAEKAAAEADDEDDDEDEEEEEEEEAPAPVKKKRAKAKPAPVEDEDDDEDDLDLDDL